MRPRGRAQLWLDAVAALTLLLPGVAAFYPTFGGVVGLTAPLAGVVVGVVLVGISLRFAWRWWRTCLAFVLAYFALGGAAALPRTTLLGFVPSFDTLYLLLVLSAQSWRDLVTVSVPAGDFTGPAVAPWLGGLVAGGTTMWLSVRARRSVGLLIPPLLWLAAAIALGSHEAPYAVAIGLGLVVASLVWPVVRDALTERAANSQILVETSGHRSTVLARVTALLLVVTCASAGAWAVLGLTPPPAQRRVIRDYVTPPVRVADLASPLMSYRRYEVDLKNETLWTVTGLPADSRLRLATMDVYDGNVYNVAQTSATYVRVGRHITSQQGSGELANVRIGTEAYEGEWLPSAGDPVGVTFVSPRARDLADGLYFNRAAASALTTARLTKGDEVVLGARVAASLSEADRAALRGRAAGQVDMPDPEGVPAVVSKFAHEHSEQATNPYDQMVALTKKLHEDGYYSDGTDGKSRSGHHAERIATMLSADALVGDDEQYAVALALMGQELGIPTRVVLGFYPASGHVPAAWAVKGTEGHVWVEANFEGAGWVSFDPTPDRSRVPKTELPKPKPKPRPQVEPPPDPPAEPAKEPISEDPEAVKDDPPFVVPRIVWQILGATGIGASVAAPFLLVTALKRRRRGLRREAGEQVDRLAGAWNEVMDRARDLGERVPATATRAELADRLDPRYPDARLPGLAAAVDAGVFGPEAVSAGSAEHVWETATSAAAGLLTGKRWYRRLAATYSIRSLLAGSRPSGARLRASLRRATTRIPAIHRLFRRNP